MPSSKGPEKVSLTPTNPEPLASLRIWGATVELGGLTFKVPGVDATGWLEVLLAEDINVEAIFPGFCGLDAKIQVNDMILDGVINEADLEQAFLEVLEEVSGRRWWITLRLCRVLRINWETVGGLLASRGITSHGMSLSYWLDGAYTTLIEAMVKSSGDKLQQVASFTSNLVTPPPGAAKAEFDEVAEGNAFLAAMRIAR